MSERPRNRALRIVMWFVGGVVALSLLSLCAAILFGRRLNAFAQDRFPPPGRLVALKTHRLHVQSMGEGAPTVLLESGSGAWSTHWAMVQAKVAAFTRVCAYDRTGFGWSDPGPKPYDLQSSVRDLDELRTRSGESGPFVCAGWSFGGSIVWTYTQSHIDRSAGLVVVDARPSGFQTWMNEFAPEVKTMRVEFTATLRRLERLGLGPAYSWYQMRGASRDSIQGFPDATGEVLLDAGFQARQFDAMVEASDTDDLSETQLDMMRPLGDLPLIVIRHGREDMFPIAPDKAHVAEARWRELQERLATQSTDGRLVVAERSGHAIPMEEPDLVVDAIREVVMKWRARH